ncbi:MAG: phage portal protein [Pararhodobacter sp.]
MRLPAALSRLLGRTAPPLHVRRFDGAAGGRRGWGAGTFGRVGTETAAAGPTLRTRARYLANNNPWLAQAVANWTGALIGPGIEPTGEPEAVAVYNLWADLADADGRTDFRGLQAQIAQSMVVDGESFVQIIDSPEGPRLRVLPPELVDESMTADLCGGRFIVSGIEVNADGTRSHYHVLPGRPTDVFATSAQPVRIPANEILHIFKPLGPGQVRGVSWLAPVILPAGELDQLLDALLMGVKVAAMHAGFVVDLNGVGTSADLWEGEAQPSLEPGTMVRLPGGTDVKFNSPGQISEIGAFLRLNLQQLAAGLGLPEHLLSGDLTNANYSSLRAGLLPFRQRVEQIQYHTLVPQLLNPVWRAVQSWAAAAGDLPGYEDDPRRFLTVEWLPPAFMQVDPLKAVQADIAEMEAGLTSRRKLVAARGWSLADLDAELAAEGWQKPKGRADE